MGEKIEVAAAAPRKITAVHHVVTQAHLLFATNGDWRRWSVWRMLEAKKGKNHRGTESTEGEKERGEYRRYRFSLCTQIIQMRQHLYPLHLPNFRFWPYFYRRFPPQRLFPLPTYSTHTSAIMYEGFSSALPQQRERITLLRRYL